MTLVKTNRFLEYIEFALYKCCQSSQWLLSSDGEALFALGKKKKSNFHNFLLGDLNNKDEL